MLIARGRVVLLKNNCSNYLVCHDSLRLQDSRSEWGRKISHGFVEKKAHDKDKTNLWFLLQHNAKGRSGSQDKLQARRREKENKHDNNKKA